MSRNRIWTVALAATLALAGCRSTQPATTPDTGRDTRTEERPYTVITFTATVDGLAANGQVRMEKDKMIWCSMSKIVELGRAKATPDSVWVRIPVMGRYQAGDYRDLERLTGERLTFADLQAMLESPDAEERIAALARKLGVAAKLHITRREKVEQLTFPY